jgi:hypothetical protein
VTTFVRAPSGSTGKIDRDLLGDLRVITERRAEDQIVSGDNNGIEFLQKKKNKEINKKKKINKEIKKREGEKLPFCLIINVHLSLRDDCEF